jgi:hypothetical protein
VGKWTRLCVELVTRSTTPARPEVGGFWDVMHVAENGRGEEKKGQNVL